jgi:hypothetical protein
MMNALLDGLGFRIDMKFMLYQFPRDSRHVNGIPCKDIPIFLEEFASVSSYLWSRLFSMCVTLEGSLGNSWMVLVSLSSDWIYNLDAFASSITGSGGDSVMTFLRFYCSTEASKASAISRLSRL